MHAEMAVDAFNHVKAKASLAGLGENGCALVASLHTSSKEALSKVPLLIMLQPSWSACASEWVGLRGVQERAVCRGGVWGCCVCHYGEVTCVECA